MTTIFISFVFPGENHKIIELPIDEYPTLLERLNLNHLYYDVETLLSKNGMYYYTLNSFLGRAVCVFLISNSSDKIETLSCGVKLGFEANIYKKNYKRDEQNLN